MLYWKEDIIEKTTCGHDFAVGIELHAGEL